MRQDRRVSRAPAADHGDLRVAVIIAMRTASVPEPQDSDQPLPAWAVLWTTELTRNCSASMARAGGAERAQAHGDVEQPISLRPDRRDRGTIIQAGGAPGRRDGPRSRSPQDEAASVAEP